MINNAPDKNGYLAFEKEYIREERMKRDPFQLEPAAMQQAYNILSREHDRLMLEVARMNQTLDVISGSWFASLVYFTKRKLGLIKPVDF